MGKWATYQRRGGGPPTPPLLVQINLAIIDSAFTIIAEYSGPVTAGDFVPATFAAFPDEIFVNTVTQGDPISLVLTFLDDISIQTSLTYSGSVPGVLTPQTIPIT